MNNLLIKQIRLALGMNQLEFAKLLGVSQSYVGLIEKGRRIPTDRIVRKIREEVDPELIKKVNELLNLRLTLQK